MLNGYGYIDAAIANINPMMETALSVFNQALKYLALERTVNFGASIVKYYDPQPGDAVLATPNLVGVFAGHIHRWQTARCQGQNLFTVPGNQEGRRLEMVIMIIR